MLKASTIAAICLVLMGCATDRSFKTGNTFPLIDYRLPQTAVKATIPLTLVRCGREALEVEGTFALEAEGRATQQTFTLTPAALESARIKRSLEVKLHDTGSIASINAANADQTGTIVGNVLKFAASIAGSVFGLNLAPGAAGGGNPTLCNAESQDALTRLTAIDKAIADNRKKLPFSPKDYRANSLMLERLFAERQALLAGPLHVDLEAALDLAAATATPGNAGYAGTSDIDLGPVASKWLTEDIQTVPSGTISWTAAPRGGGAATFAASTPAALCAPQLESAGGSGLCFAEPVIAGFSATATFSALVSGNGDALKLTVSKAFPVPQWGSLRFLPLNVAVGSSRETALTFDKFGRVSEMKWASEARAANLTAAGADIAAQVQGIVAANSETNRQKAEIEALETQLKLNRLRACREILDQGGSACPADADLQSGEE